MQPTSVFYTVLKLSNPYISVIRTLRESFFVGPDILANGLCSAFNAFPLSQLRSIVRRKIKTINIPGPRDNHAAVVVFFIISFSLIPRLSRVACAVN